MPTIDAVKNAAADGAVALLTHAAVHTADPEPAGGNESTAARQAITWNAAASGVASANATLQFTGGASSGPATHVGLWSAVSAGVFRASSVLTGDQTFNAAGEYNVTSLTVTVADG